MLHNTKIQVQGALPKVVQLHQEQTEIYPTTCLFIIYLFIKNTSRLSDLNFGSFILIEQAPIMQIYSFLGGIVQLDQKNNGPSLPSTC